MPNRRPSFKRLLTLAALVGALGAAVPAAAQAVGPKVAADPAAVVDDSVLGDK